MKQNEEAIKYIHEAEKLMLENDFTIRHILIIFSEISYVIQENMYKPSNTIKSNER